MFQTTNQEFSVWPQPSHAEHLLLVVFWGTGNGYVTFPNFSQDNVNHVFLHRKVGSYHSSSSQTALAAAGFSSPCKLARHREQEHKYQWENHTQGIPQSYVFGT